MVVLLLILRRRETAGFAWFALYALVTFLLFNVWQFASFLMLTQGAIRGVAAGRRHADLAVLRRSLAVDDG